MSKIKRFARKMNDIEVTRLEYCRGFEIRVIADKGTSHRFVLYDKEIYNNTKLYRFLLALGVDFGRATEHENEKLESAEFFVEFG